MRSSQEITAFGKKNIEWTEGMMAHSNRERRAALPNTILFIVQQLQRCIFFDYGIFANLLCTFYVRVRTFVLEIFYQSFNYSFLLLMMSGSIETGPHLRRGSWLFFIKEARAFLLCLRLCTCSIFYILSIPCVRLCGAEWQVFSLVIYVDNSWERQAPGACRPFQWPLGNYKLFSRNYQNRFE